MVDRNLIPCCQKIREMLVSGNYNVSKYSISTIVEGGKERELMKLPYYPDRIIQWAILLVIEPHITRGFTYHTCASIEGRGQNRAVELMDRYMKDEENTVYCLKIDVRHFYPNIDRGILKDKLRDLFKDPKLLALLDKIIDSPPGDRGIPIESYLSQYLANFYLSDLDHKIKETWKMKYVVRYMDDIVILHKNKNRLRFILEDIQFILKKYYNLELKGNYQIFPVDKRGADFCGYRFFHGYTLLRNRTKRNMIKKLTKIKQDWEKGTPLNEHTFGTINAYNGILLHCDSYRLYQKYLEPLLPALVDYRARNKMKPLQDMRRKDKYHKRMERELQRANERAEDNGYFEDAFVPWEYMESEENLIW